jgi:hypothetical protein
MGDEYVLFVKNRNDKNKWVRGIWLVSDSRENCLRKLGMRGGGRIVKKMPFSKLIIIFFQRF